MADGGVMSASTAIARRSAVIAPSRLRAASVTAGRLAGVSIVIPCRDDEETAVAAVLNAAEAGALIADEHEIIVVDDASADASADRVAGLMRAGTPVKLLLHASRKGYAQALRTGVEAARHPWVVLADAAFELDLRQLEHFLVFSADHDLLLGRRTLRHASMAARANAAIWDRLVARATGAPAHDVDCPLKLVRRELLERVAAARPAIASAELLLAVRELGARVVEVPVHESTRLAGAARSGMSPRIRLRTIMALMRVARVRERAADRVDVGGASRGRPLAGVVVVTGSALAGVGWLYLLTKTAATAEGPRLGGALPLQQLAGGASQPVSRIVLAWLPAGALGGAALSALRAGRRPAFAVGGLTGATLLLTGAASDAIANSDPFTSRLAPQLVHPGLLAAVALATAGAAAVTRSRRKRGRR